MQAARRIDPQSGGKAYPQRSMYGPNTRRALAWVRSSYRKRSPQRIGSLVRGWQRADWLESQQISVREKSSGRVSNRITAAKRPWLRLAHVSKGTT